MIHFLTLGDLVDLSLVFVTSDNIFLLSSAHHFSFAICEGEQKETFLGVGLITKSLRESESLNETRGRIRELAVAATAAGIET